VPFQIMKLERVGMEKNGEIGCLFRVVVGEGAEESLTKVLQKLTTA